MPESGGQDRLILGESEQSTCSTSIRSAGHHPQRRRKASQLDRRCRVQLSEPVDPVPPAADQDFVSTFHLSSRRPVRRQRKRSSTSALEGSNNGTIFSPLHLGGPNHACPYCGAHLWFDESVRGRGQVASPVYNKCCWGGSIHLPLYKPPPEPLLSLLTGRNHALSFDGIRCYNSMFAMTSMASINDVRGPYVFKISGQLCHRIGSLIPRGRTRPEYCQLYIRDTENEVNNRIAVGSSNDHKFHPDEDIVKSLIAMFNIYNPVVQLFRTARERISEQREEQCFVRIFAVPNQHGNVYSAPVASEVVGLVVNDLGTTDEGHDLIVEAHASQLQKIKETHCKFMAMQYPILFPYGEDGFYKDLKYHPCLHSESIQRRNVTMAEYYAYRLHRAGDFNTPLRGKKLTQAYVVDGSHRTTPCFKVFTLASWKVQLQAKELSCHHHSPGVHAITIRISGVHAITIRISKTVWPFVVGLGVHTFSSHLLAMLCGQK